MIDSRSSIKVAVAITITLVAGGLVYLLYANRSVTKKRPPSTVVPIVEAVKITPRNEKIYIQASGTVIPAKQTAITAEVEGKIISLNSRLVPGGLVKGGELLLQIDPADYALQVKERKAAVDEALSLLELEKGQQVIARQEWEIFEKQEASPQTDNRLALREPHLRSAEAGLEAARSRLELAKLALKRTEIRAPFTGVVIEESVEKGQFIAKQLKVATLAGSSYFWIQASLLPANVERITFPERGERGSSVKITVESNGRNRVLRRGVVEKLLPDLDPKGRMARILIRIDDPLNLNRKKGLGKVLLGSFVKLEIEAGAINGVYVIPREAVADGERLLILKEDGTLDIRKTDVQWRREKDLLVSADIKEGERLIVSRLQNALPGMRLRTVDEGPEKKEAHHSEDEIKGLH